MTRTVATALAVLMLITSQNGVLAAPDAEPHLTLELNSLAQAGADCRVGLVLENGLGHDLESFDIELAVFDGAGGIADFLTVGFPPMPEGKTRVLQFDLTDRACADVGRLLINDVPRCTAGPLDPAVCRKALRPRSRTETLFGL